MESMVSQLQSEATAKSLGDAVEGAALVATMAVDKTSVSVRATAPTIDAARESTQAFAAELSELYQSFVAELADRRLASVDAGIAALDGSTGAGQPNGPENASTLAELRVERESLTEIAGKTAPTPEVRQLSSSSNRGATAALLALAFGLLAAGVVAMSGLSTRRLRYRDDIDGVTGAGTLISEISRAHGNWGVGQVIDRLSARGPVTLIPVGARPADDLRESIVGEATSEVELGEPFARSAGSAALRGPVVLVVRLGQDKRSDLDLAHRAFSVADGPFAGVIAVTRDATKVR
ncbi:hypothetical protein C7S10_04900 [Nocardioides currus]|uniref:Uncharacterized protein n=1 Tax=Nocardioides currus TaxID=2133958 RepID=A0A2R7Z344_9ACTN|nr:hypothetical protein C7S10_04900 [Nocardioides currus]